MKAFLSPPPRPLLAAASALFLLASCSFLGNDQFPAYDQRTLARIDLDSAAESIWGGSGIQELGTMSYLEAGSSSALFVELRMKDNGHGLLALDGYDLGDPKGYGYSTYAFGNQVSLAASGAYVSGSVAFSADREPSLVALPAAQALLSEGGLNYCLSFSSPLTLTIAVYTSAYSFVSSASIAVAASGSWQLRSAGQGDGKYCILFQNTGGGYRGLIVASVADLYAGAASAAWTSLFDDPNVPSGWATGTANSDFGSMWITADGLVYRTNGNDGTTLVLAGTGGAESSYTLKDEGDANFAFDPSGRYWFMYESRSGRLYKMRTWW